jgi:integrase
VKAMGLDTAEVRPKLARRGVRGPGYAKQIKHGKEIWMIDFLYPGPKGRKSRFKRKAQIQTAAGARAECERRKLLAMEFGNPDGAPAEDTPTVPTFSEFWRDYFLPVYMALECRPSTIERYMALWKQIETVFGRMRLDQVKRADWDRFILSLKQRRRRFKNGRPDRVGVQTRPYSVFLAGFFHAAHERAEVIDKVPFKVQLEKRGKKIPKCPTEAEVQIWLSRPEHQRTWIDDMVALAALGGLRLSEIRSLRKDDIDLDAGVINVCRAVSGREILDRTKGEDDRQVALHPELRTILEPRLRQMLFGNMLVIRRRGGAMPSRQAVLTNFYLLQDALGTTKKIQTEGGEYLKRWSFHSLRHFSFPL